MAQTGNKKKIDTDFACFYLKPAKFENKPNKAFAFMESYICKGKCIEYANMKIEGIPNSHTYIGVYTAHVKEANNIEKDMPLLISYKENDNVLFFELAARYTFPAIQKALLQSLIDDIEDNVNKNEDYPIYCDCGFGKNWLTKEIEYNQVVCTLHYKTKKGDKYTIEEIDD